MEPPSWARAPGPSLATIAALARVIENDGRAHQGDRLFDRTDFTRRDEANVLTAYAFRTSYLESLHAGATGFSDEEMRKLMIETSAKLAFMLAARDHSPDVYVQFLFEYGTAYSSQWERQATSVLLAQDHIVPCARCTKDVRTNWSYCASCGADLDPAST